MAEVAVRPLEPGDDRSDFVSGDPDLDRFFQKYAAQNQFRHHVGTTYVAVIDGRIVGFATLSAASIHVDDIPEKLADGFRTIRSPCSALRGLRSINAVGSRELGGSFCGAVLLLAHEMADRIGCIGVLVDAKPDAVEYYRQYGFEELEILEGALGDRPPPIPMFLPLAAVPDLGKREK